ncbi:MAG TPA: hypothetical protein VK163_03045 [Opitutaceae bacterium]|nr:hypothetical protein [Opitutaceae bacterium]
MRPDEVPQENAPVLGGVRKLVYVVDSSGHYRAACSGGSEIETSPTEEAVAWFARLAAEARARAARGESSPLEYHMYRLRLDVPTLAAAAGLWQWRVRRHLRPAVFARLSPRLLARYADAMGLTVDQLRTLD